MASQGKKGLNSLIHDNSTIKWEENSCVIYHPNLTKTPLTIEKRKVHVFNCETTIHQNSTHSFSY